MRYAPSWSEQTIDTTASPLAGNAEASRASKGVTAGAWGVTPTRAVDSAPDAVL